MIASMPLTSRDGGSVSSRFQLKVNPIGNFADREYQTGKPMLNRVGSSQRLLLSTKKSSFPSLSQRSQTSQQMINLKARGVKGQTLSQTKQLKKGGGPTVDELFNNDDTPTGGFEMLTTLYRMKRQKKQNQNSNTGGNKESPSQQTQKESSQEPQRNVIMSSERMMKPLSPERIIAKPKKHLVKKRLLKVYRPKLG